ncbi:MAG: hypothetical protein COB59_01115 [Rhodospirillaceae bacterium]|nr:MAG: hypothetical protein COB59_01115 [Rhodospirillaceae bacterium]
MNILRRFIYILACGLYAAPSYAATTTHGDWLAYSQKERGNQACIMSSEPSKSAGKYTKRGQIYLIIAHRPSEQRYNEVSFQAGYTLKKESTVLAVIDGKTKFSLQSNKGHAWTIDAQTDEAMIKAMRAGTTLVVKGVSSRGTKTTDTFSLKGFTAAVKSINKTCKVK